MSEEVKNDQALTEFKQMTMAPVDASRQIAEIQAQVVMAKRFPRDEHEAVLRIKKACERATLAKESVYAYPRGGETVTGPSIRLAEVIAQNWGNMDYGIKELGNDGEWSEAEAFCWDLETNVRVVKRFRLKLERHTKKGKYALTDPRDVYEHVANYGMRRVRACILSVIPGDIVDEAVSVCKATLASKDKGVPLEDRIRNLVYGFDKVGVSKDHLEERLQHSVDNMNVEQVLEYGRIYNSIKDGQSKRDEWFLITKPVETDQTNSFKERLKNFNGETTVVEGGEA